MELFPVDLSLFIDICKPFMVEIDEIILEIISNHFNNN